MQSVNSPAAQLAGVVKRYGAKAALFERWSPKAARCC